MWNGETLSIFSYYLIIINLQPLNIANILEVFGIHLFDNFNVIHSFVLLAHLNSALDPILYAYGLPDFHKSFKKLLRRSDSLDSST